jgi:hypothetical protein
MNEQKPKIFLSYAHEDMGMAKRIYKDLKHYGLDIWFDSVLLLPGQNWKDAIEKAIKQSTYYIVLLSSYTLTETGFVQKEMKIAFEILKQCAEDDIHIVPVRIEECNPSYITGLSNVRWIDLFPESEYRDALKKILYIVSPRAFSLRNQPTQLSQADVNNTIRLHDFFDKSLNPEGRGFNHQYKELTIKGNKIIVDEKTNLIWQQAGSPKEMNFKDTEEWINELNQRGHAGFEDWRLPTLEEAMSLMEYTQKNAFLFIDPVFDSKQTWIWTADQVKGESRMWAIHFLFGRCNFSPIDINLYVRAVRSVNSLIKNNN